MPGSPQGLKESLMRAIDDSGNVLDMVLLLQVVSDLESAVLTAEDLTSTRLGLYINNARRKTNDKSLARRMKELLKEWKLLVQQQTTHVQSNGIPPTQITKQTTPPTAVTPQPVNSTEMGVVSKPTSALSHRKALLSRLSAIKPQTTPITTPIILENIELSSPVTPPTVAISNGETSDTLTVSLPLERLPRQHEELIVSIPLKLVQVGVALSQNGSVPYLYSSNSLSPLSEPHPSHTHSLNEPLIVSIPRSLLMTTPLHSDWSTHTRVNSIQDIPIHVHDDDTSCNALTTPTMTTPLVQSCDLPAHCTHGVNGVIWNNGSWYNWTEIIHNPDPIITVLPYVYIDGLDLSEQLM